MSKRSNRAVSNSAAPYIPKPPTPKRLRTDIRLDAIHPADYLKYEMPFACEDCTHFHQSEQRCTLEYNSAHHLREYQKKCYELSGKVALCRFLEID